MSPSIESSPPNKTLYCHCIYAKIIDEEQKAEVLRRLVDSQQDFEAVPDLCEMSARKDPTLKTLAGAGPVRIAACFPRAVKWLFAAADASLHEDTRVFNMRDESANAVADGLLSQDEPAAGVRMRDLPKPTAAGPGSEQKSPAEMLADSKQANQGEA